MTGLIDTRAITCPHCGETIEIVIDLSVPDQSYIEDCSVCCRPITISVVAEDGEIVELDATSAE
jgi:hypothetical protein